MATTDFEAAAFVGTESSDTTQGRIPRYSQPVFWLILGLLGLGLHLLIAEPGMFPGWDEAVFFSQTGDILGVDSNPAGYAASREPGTPLLISAFRALGLQMEGVRIAYGFLYTSVVAMAFFLMSPTLRWGASAGFVVMVGHWIPLAYSTRFFGVPTAAAFMLLGVACGVRLLEESAGRWRWVWGVGLAVATIVMLAMRHLEAPIAAVVIFGTLIMFAAKRGEGRVWFVLGAGLSALLGIALLAVWRAIEYHGSVGAWLDALRTQLGRVPVNADDVTTRFLKVSASLVGRYHMWFRETIPTSTWINTVIAAAILLTTLIVQRFNWTRSETAGRERAVSVRLLWTISLGLILGYLGMFVFGRYPSFPKDRYLMWFLGAAALIVALLLRRVDQRSGLMAISAAAVIWIAGSLGAAQHDIDYFMANGDGLRRLGSTMHMLAGGDECVAKAQYGAPAIQLASGCRVESIDSIDDALVWLTEASDGRARFLTYQSDADLPSVPGWNVIENPGGSVSLWYDLRDS